MWLECGWRVDGGVGGGVGVQVEEQSVEVWGGEGMRRREVEQVEGGGGAAVVACRALATAHFGLLPGP